MRTRLSARTQARAHLERGDASPTTAGEECDWRTECDLKCWMRTRLSARTQARTLRAETDASSSAPDACRQDQACANRPHVRNIFWDALIVSTRTTTNVHCVKQQMCPQSQLRILMASDRGPFFIAFNQPPTPLPPPGKIRRFAL
jgi:hypothetical protein